MSQYADYNIENRHAFEAVAEQGRRSTLLVMDRLAYEVKHSRDLYAIRALNLAQLSPKVVMCCKQTKGVYDVLKKACHQTARY